MCFFKRTILLSTLFHLVFKTIIIVYHNFVNSFAKIFYPFLKKILLFLKKCVIIIENIKIYDVKRNDL